MRGLASGVPGGLDSMTGPRAALAAPTGVLAYSASARPAQLQRLRTPRQPDSLRLQLLLGTDLSPATVRGGPDACLPGVPRGVACHPVAWQTWSQLAGEQYAVPMTAASLLADDPEGWVGVDDRGLYSQSPRRLPFRLPNLGGQVQQGWRGLRALAGSSSGEGRGRHGRVLHSAQLAAPSGGDNWIPGWFCADWGGMQASCP